MAVQSEKMSIQESNFQDYLAQQRVNQANSVLQSSRVDTSNYGAVPRQYYGTSSMQYGEVSEAGYIDRPVVSGRVDITQPSRTEQLRQITQEQQQQLVDEYQTGYKEREQQIKDFETKNQELEMQKARIEQLERIYKRQPDNQYVYDELSFNVEDYNEKVKSQELKSVDINRSISGSEGKTELLRDLGAYQYLQREKAKPLTEKWSQIESKYYNKDEQGNLQLKSAWMPDFAESIYLKARGYDKDVTEYNMLAENYGFKQNESSVDFSGLKPDLKGVYSRNLDNTISANKELKDRNTFFMGKGEYEERFASMRLIAGSEQRLQSQQPTDVTQISALRDTPMMTEMLAKKQAYKELNTNLAAYDIRQGAKTSAEIGITAMLPNIRYVSASTKFLPKLGQFALGGAKAMYGYHVGMEYGVPGLRVVENVAISPMNILLKSEVKGQQKTSSIVVSSFDEKNYLESQSEAMKTTRKTPFGIIGRALPLTGELPVIGRYFINPETYKESLQRKGYSDYEGVRASMRPYNVMDAIGKGYIGAQSEFFGKSGIIATVKQTPLKNVNVAQMKWYESFIPTNVGKSEAYKQVSSRISKPLAWAGRQEGVGMVYADIEYQQRESSWWEYPVGAVLGGVSAKYLGRQVIMLQAAKKTKTSSAWLNTLYAIDPSEPVGDVWESQAAKIRLRTTGEPYEELYTSFNDNRASFSVEQVTRPKNVFTVTPQMQMEASYEMAKTRISPDSRTISTTYEDVTNVRATPQTRTVMPLQTRTQVRSTMPVQVRSTIPVQVRSTSMVDSFISSPVSTKVQTPITTDMTLPSMTQMKTFTPMQSLLPSLNVPMTVNQPITSPTDIFANIPTTVPSNVPTTVPSTVPTPVNVPIIPGLPVFPIMFGGSGKYGKGRGGKRKTGYQASMDAVLLGITSTKKPTKMLYSGFETRPMIVEKKRRR